MNPWRPTKYKEDFDYVKVANEYLDTCGREQTKLPKISEFCEKLDIDDTTGSEWVKQYPNSNFSLAYKKVFKRQEETLIDDGLYGGKEVNPSMAIFLLKANHGMVETEKKLVGNADGSNLESLVIIKDGT